MTRALAAFAVAGVAVLTASGAGSAATVALRIQPTSGAASAIVPAGVPAFATWHPRTITLKHAPLSMPLLQQQSLSGQTIPFWTSQITSPLDSHTYTTSMVGSNPFTTSTNTNVKYFPLIIVYQFPDGTVFDPTQAGCGDTISVANRFFNSPIFQPGQVVSNGTNASVGAINGTQLVGAFQRANFWQYTHNSNYNVTLAPAHTPVIVTLQAPKSSKVVRLFTVPGDNDECGNTLKPLKLGLIDINLFDLQIESVIAAYSRPNQLPIALTYNVATDFGSDCCFLGYHNAVPVPGGTQTYAVGGYFDSHIFRGVDDVAVWAHEIGEWMDDPFVQANVPNGGADDLTPPWGDTGQVQGACQNNLEVGDPLSGTELALAGGYGNFTYHTQDLAFEDWFYRTPSKGTGGNYSMFGYFTTGAAACPAGPPSAFHRLR